MMGKVRALLMCTFFTVVAGGVLLSVVVQAQPRGRILVGYTGRGTPHAFLFVTKDGGFFARQGLDVALVAMRGDGQGIPVLIGGSIHFLVGGASGPIRVDLGGGDLVIIAATYNVHPFHLIASPDVKSPADLKGRLAGVSSVGAGDYWAVYLALERLGLNPDKDVRYVNVGTQLEKFAALKAGAIQVTPLALPTYREAVKLGFTYLADVAALGVPFSLASISAKRPYVEAHRDVTLRLLRAIIEGIAFLKAEANRERVMAIIGQNFGIRDREVQEAFAREMAKNTAQNPSPRPESFKNVLMTLARTGLPQAATADLNRFVDLSFLKQLEQEGFLK